MSTARDEGWGDTRAIVVGVDGSEPSHRAARWAAEEALRRGLSLRLVCCVPSDAPVAVARKETRTANDRLLEVVTNDVRAVTGDAVEVDGVVVEGPPAQSLVQESQNASLLVMASHGHSGVTPHTLLSGSTSLEVTAEAACPVVVVPESSAADPDAPVLVGVDASEVAEPALEFAFGRAAARDVGLVAVHAWRRPRSVDASPREGETIDVAGEEVTAREELAQALRAWQQRYPQVTVEQRVVQGDAAACLTEASYQGVDVLVVGSRGLKEWSGLAHGSVSQDVLRHAHRPVVIVR
jgi:nucleotide-binding universal stress UspA family protein